MSKVILKHGKEFFKLLKVCSADEGYSIHQILWNLFPNDGEKKRDFLFRKVERSQKPSFYMVSKTEPVSQPAFSVVTKNYEPVIAKGDKLAFTLTANPVVARKTDGKKHSAKHDVWMDAKREALTKQLSLEETTRLCEQRTINWLAERGKSNGFELIKVTVDAYSQHNTVKKKGGHRIKYSTADYQGILAVTEPEKFCHLLFKGIGKSKAFGCGLMLVRRI